MKHFLTCLMAATAISSYAQTTDKVLARVNYNFSHLQDTTNKDQVHTEQMLLIIGRNASLYTSALKVTQVQEVKEMMIKAGAQQGGMMPAATTSFRTTSSATSGGSFENISVPTQTDYFFFSKEQKFYTKEQLIKSYLVQEEAPKIDWKITKDTISFSGIHCQKATAHFKGRNWIAWYSTELPFQSGPWKLNGLPGLIIEAYDENKEVQFKFAGIEKATAENSSSKDKNKSETSGMGPEMQNYINEVNSYLGDEIKLPENIIRTNVKEMNKLKKAMEKDPEGFFKAQMETGTGFSGRTGMSAVSISGGFFTGVQENNPIEKAEK